MEWEMNQDDKPQGDQPKNNQFQSAEPQPAELQPVEPKPTLLAEETEHKELTCKLPGFGHFFSEVFSTYKKNFWTFLTLSAIPSAALFLIVYYSRLSETATNPLVPLFLFFVLIYPVAIILSIWSDLSLLQAIKERENKISIGKALARGWSVLGSGIWISFLSFIIVLGGYILFVIPGIIFSIWFSLALYVLVNENKKGMAALKRSKELISGYIIAFWGRTLLFSLFLGVIFFLFFFLIKFASVLLPFLSYASTIASIIIAPLSVIFGFLIYENIKKAKEAGCAKSPTEIKYILIALLIFLIPVIGVLASIVLVNVNSARTTTKDVQAKAYMSQLPTAIEMYAAKRADYSYDGVSCLVSSDLVSTCNSIKEAASSEPTILSSEGEYCSYVKLPKGGYLCVDNKYGLRETVVFPGGLGYCDGLTLVCP
jgi:type II secretory pathway pseudopilin PulG